MDDPRFSSILDSFKKRDFSSSLSDFFEYVHEDSVDDEKKIFLYKEVLKTYKEFNEKIDLNILFEFSELLYKKKLYEESIKVYKEILTIKEFNLYYEKLWRTYLDLGEIQKSKIVASSFLLFLLEKKNISKGLEFLEKIQTSYSWNITYYQVSFYIIQGNYEELSKVLTKKTFPLFIESTLFENLKWREFQGISDCFVDFFYKRGELSNLKLMLEIVFDIIAFHGLNYRSSELLLRVSRKINSQEIASSILKNTEFPNSIYRKIDTKLSFIMEEMINQNEEKNQKIISEKRDAVSKKIKNIEKSSLEKDINYGMFDLLEFYSNKKLDKEDIFKSLNENFFEKIYKIDFDERIDIINSCFQMENYELALEILKSDGSSFLKDEERIYLILEALLSSERYYELIEYFNEINLESFSEKDALLFNYMKAEAYFKIGNDKKASIIYKKIKEKKDNFRLLEKRLKDIEHI